MPRETIRYRLDGDGWWYVLRDRNGKVVAEAWRQGTKGFARDEARRVRDRMRHSQRAA